MKRDPQATQYRAGGNRRVWLIPVVKAASLKRILANAGEAVAAHTSAAKAAKIEQWLGYVEGQAQMGSTYERGIVECQDRGVKSFPDLQRRLDAAIALAAETRRRQQQARAAERFADWEARAPARAATRQARTLFPLGRGPALNRPMRVGDSVRVYTGTGKNFLISEDDPSVHGSHLLGYEGASGCYFYWRDATPDELAELERTEEARRAEESAARARGAEISAVAEEIRETGIIPEGTNDTEGRRLIDSQNVHGGGEWFIVGTEWIWYCQNNGADGDDWSRNNVRTAGAGAIGWRVPRTPELAARLERLAAT